MYTHMDSCGMRHIKQRADAAFDQRLHDVVQAGNGVLDLSRIALHHLDPDKAADDIVHCAGKISTLRMRHVDFSSAQARTCLRDIMSALTASHCDTMTTLDMTQAHHALQLPVVDLVIEEALGNWLRVQHVHVDGCTTDPVGYLFDTHDPDDPDETADSEMGHEDGLQRLATAVAHRIPRLGTFTAVHAARDSAHARTVMRILAAEPGHPRWVQSAVSSPETPLPPHTFDYDDVQYSMINETLFLTN